tara:strand:+ start:8255 stop:8674 length:420 start_codon:yes stop_codon:yes gene_type:complete
MKNQYLHIKSKELSFKARLLWDVAPKTCEAILKILPLTGKLMQTRWSGFGVWIDLGEVQIEEVPFENNTIYLAKGELMFYPGFESMKEIVIPYDKVAFASKAGLLSANHFATIENLSEVSELGRRVIEEGLQPVIFDTK